MPFLKYLYQTSSKAESIEPFLPGFQSGKVIQCCLFAPPGSHPCARICLRSDNGRCCCGRLVGLTPWNVGVTCSTSHAQHRAIFNLGMSVFNIVGSPYYNICCWPMTLPRYGDSITAWVVNPLSVRRSCDQVPSTPLTAASLDRAPCGKHAREEGVLQHRTRPAAEVCVPVEQT